MVPLAGRPLICYPLAAILKAGLRPLVVAKPGTELPDAGAAGTAIQVVRERPADSHPLHGVVAALQAAAGRPVVVVACDMPLVNARLLRWLADLPGTAVPLAGGSLHPLLARYEPSAIAPLSAAARLGRPARAAVQELEPRLLAEADLAPFGDPGQLLLNVNDRRDLARAAALLTSGDAALSPRSPRVPPAG